MRGPSCPQRPGPAFRQSLGNPSAVREPKYSRRGRPSGLSHSNHCLLWTPAVPTVHTQDLLPEASHTDCNTNQLPKHKPGGGSIQFWGKSIMPGALRESKFSKHVRTYSSLSSAALVSHPHPGFIQTLETVLQFPVFSPTLVSFRKPSFVISGKGISAKWRADVTSRAIEAYSSRGQGRKNVFEEQYKIEIPGGGKEMTRLQRGMLTCLQTHQRSLEPRFGPEGNTANGHTVGN